MGQGWASFVGLVLMLPFLLWGCFRHKDVRFAAFWKIYYKKLRTS